MSFRPAPVDSGIIFVRGDVDKPVRIPALVGNRIEAPRRTVLRAGRVCVEMVEHVLAALAGLRIDNCEVWIDQPELPGCDGSSLAYVRAFQGAGIVEQPAARSQLVVRETTRLGDDDCWIEAQPTSGAGLSLKYRLDYGGDSPIGRQTLSLEVTPRTFCHELAASRTFLLKAEAEWLRAQGIATRTTAKDLLIFDEDGPIDNALRFEDECVRHKALDLVGDLSLGGCDIVGHIVAHKSGHRLNAELLRVLLAEGELQECRRRSA